MQIRLIRQLAIAIVSVVLALGHAVSPVLAVQRTQGTQRSGSAVQPVARVDYGYDALTPGSFRSQTRLAGTPASGDNVGSAPVERVCPPRCQYDAHVRVTTSPEFVATKAVPCASFRADTLVLMADGAKKPIGEVEVGDKVVATDPVTGKTSVREVTRLFTHIDDDLLDLVVLTDDGVETIHTTDHHRFWNDTTKTWVEVKDLKSGDRLLTADGDVVTVGELKRVPGAAPMLDLTVEYDHTFYVALNDTAVLVHNQTCNLVSRIGENPRLVKEAQALEGTAQQASVDSLTSQLNAGNMNPGIGSRSLFEGIFEARARDGARVYFRNGLNGTIEILAKSTKANQDGVISTLRRVYGS